jgi:putative transposase
MAVLHETRSNNKILSGGAPPDILAQTTMSESSGRCRTYPPKLRLDNGPEFVALAWAEWAERKGTILDFIERGQTTQNGFIERFNGSFRRGVLGMHVFRALSEVREQAEHWLVDYNREVPHDSLGGLTPA